MKDRIAIVAGIRTPFAKAGTILAGISAYELGAKVVKELIEMTDIDPKEIDELIIGNVAQPTEAANISRVIAMISGIPLSKPAYTVHRNCASGIQSVVSAAMQIRQGESNIILAGGTESMSNIPLYFGKKMTALFNKLFKAKTLPQKIAAILKFRLGFLKPTIGVVQGLTDPVCGLSMGQTAEVLAKEFKISRTAQDKFALNSHKKAIAAKEKLREEIIPFPLPPKFEEVILDDNGPREDQSMAALAKLKPYFDRHNGTVTVGNACPLTDGAAVVLVMKESIAKKKGYQPLGYIRDFAFAGLEPNRMGLGPVYATAKLLKKTGLKMKDIKLIELNEAFAAQVLANIEAFKSKDFAKKYLDQDKEVGAINENILNVNGGAVALGHPVGTTGTRMIITLLKEMKRRKVNLGLATLCIGGGQGGSILLEL